MTNSIILEIKFSLALLVSWPDKLNVCKDAKLRPILGARGTLIYLHTQYTNYGAETIATLPDTDDIPRSILISRMRRKVSRI